MNKPIPTGEASAAIQAAALPAAKLKRKRDRLRYFCIVLIVIFYIGLSIFLYPTISNLVAKTNAVLATQSYEKYITALSDEQLKKEWVKAQVYNENLRGDPAHDPFIPGSGIVIPDNYDKVLNIENNGIMGYLEIPCVDIQLPIFHGSTDEVMRKGAGHIEQTALPIGGKGTHAVLTSHTGLPEAKLFTDLEEMVEGDNFFIYVLGEKLTYTVDDITVILPEEIDKLRAVEDEDYITLVTCTPYGVNDHRLLVRGTRTPNDAVVESQPVKKSYASDWVPIVSIYLGASVISLALLCAERKRISRQSVNDRKRRILQQLQEMETGQALPAAFYMEETALPAESPGGNEASLLDMVTSYSMAASHEVERSAVKPDISHEKCPYGMPSDTPSKTRKHKLSDLYNTR